MKFIMNDVQNENMINLSDVTYENIYSHLFLSEVVNLQNTCKAAYVSINPSLQDRKEYKLVTMINSKIKKDKLESAVYRVLGGLLSLSPLVGCKFLIDQFSVMSSRWSSLVRDWKMCSDDNKGVFIPENINQCAQRSVLAKIKDINQDDFCKITYQLLGGECATYVLSIAGTISLGLLAICLLKCCAFKSNCCKSTLDDLPQEAADEFKTKGGQAQDPITLLQKNYTNPLDEKSFRSSNEKVDLSTIKSFSRQPFFQRKPVDLVEGQVINIRVDRVTDSMNSLAIPLLHDDLDHDGISLSIN